MSFHQKRDFERVTSNTPLTLFYNNDMTQLEGMCKDVSESGLGLQTHRPLSLGTECNVKIHDGRPNNTKYQALIEIVRVRAMEIGGEELFEMGAVIVHRYSQ